MCGIVGYIGHRDAYSIILNGLKRLEYRGYDSSGIALYDGENIKLCKTKFCLILGPDCIIEEKTTYSKEKRIPGV